MNTVETSDRLSKEQLRQQVEELLSYDDIELADDDNLLECGLDSMAIMQLVNQWRASGQAITFAELLELPTLTAWHKLLS